MQSIKTQFRLLLFCLMIPGVVLSAPRVLKVLKNQKFLVISHPVGKRWNVGDRVCVGGATRRTACGNVVKRNAQKALVKVTERLGRVRRGYKVQADSPYGSQNNANRFSPRKNDRELALMKERDSTKAALYDALVQESAGEEGPYVYDISFVGSAGFNHFYPALHFQYAVSTDFAIGIEPLFFTSTVENTRVTSFGAFATLNYYGRSMYRGLWGQFGPGFYVFKASQSASANASESTTSFALLGTIGWREGWDLGLNIGLAAGLQYVTRPNITLVNIEFANLQPSVIVEIGWNF